ncbi:MAG: transcriptional regulator, TetR family [Ilumatobacteraceae bacterium]|nr:transcriptional regulator, TetR family [Ilumatobacteraceae bacterium]
MSPRTIDDASTAILGAARDLLANEGQAALTVRRIASAAGGSTMNVYSRFGGKDGVVDALLIEGFEQLAEAVRDVAVTADPMADLEACAHSYRTFALSHRSHYELMFDRVVPGYEMSEVAHLTAAAALITFADRVQAAMDAGAMRRGDALMTATVLWSACHGPVSLEMKAVGPPDTDWAAVHQQLLTNVLAAFRASPAS